MISPRQSRGIVITILIIKTFTGACRGEHKREHGSILFIKLNNKRNREKLSGVSHTLHHTPVPLAVSATRVPTYRLSGLPGSNNGTGITQDKAGDSPSGGVRRGTRGFTWLPMNNGNPSEKLSKNGECSIFARGHKTRLVTSSNNDFVGSVTPNRHVWWT